MTLSAADLAVMSGLLDQALPLDAQGRRRWFEGLAPQYGELASALRRALLLKPTQPTVCRVGHAAKARRGPRREVRSGQWPAGWRADWPYQLLRFLGAGGMPRYGWHGAPMPLSSGRSR